MFLGELAGRRVLVVALGPIAAEGADRADRADRANRADRADWADAVDGARSWLEGIRAAISAAPDLRAAVASSGPALAAALFAAARRSRERSLTDALGPPASASHGAGLVESVLAEPSLVVSVGDAVRRAVPTAARATLSARAPLRPGLTEAQVGGPFGRALAAHADALVLLGRAAGTSVVRVLGSGEAEVEHAPAELVSLGAAARALRLGGPSARVHTLATGPGAQAGLPFANLSSFDGADPDAAPSVVGRGGLGAALAAAGVVALTVEEVPWPAGEEPVGASSPATSDPANPDPANPDPANLHAAEPADLDPGDPGSPSAGPRHPLEAALVRSPRLLSRATGGTLELAASRGSALAVDAPRRKHGCAGCPTPCGWTFEVEGRGGSRVGGRFSALQGFAERGDPLELLERCNHLGVDARAVAGLMTCFPSASPEVFFAGLLDPDSEIHAAALERTQLPGAGDTFARGDLAAEVGQALAVRGPEPLRSLSILGLDGARAREMIAPLPWSGDRERDAGTLAFWHECVAAAVDVSGFCSFSAAGLLADGVMGISELGEALGIAPEEGSTPAAVFLRSGARHLALHRELQGADGVIPDGLLERHPAAVEGYLAARDEHVEGGLFHRESPGGEGRQASAEGGPDAATDRLPAGAGPLTVLARGPLGARLSGHPGVILAGAGASPGDEVRLELAAPPLGWTAQELLAELAGACPHAAPWLLDPSGRPLPAVLEVESREGTPSTALSTESSRGPAAARRHGPGAAVELILAIPGG